MRNNLTVESIASALKGHKTGRGWLACCPAHNDHRPSLAIDSAADGSILVHCFAGCPQMEVIAALRAQGLWYGPRHHQRPLVGADLRRPSSDEADQEVARRTLEALSIWQETQPAMGTEAEAYLSTRGITLPPPATIGFHSGLRHTGGHVWPAMVALVTDGISDRPCAIHRTFLAPGGASKAPVESPKMMLGPCRGAAVRLAPAGDDVMVGEGIETCLSAMQASGRPAWAALSASGLGALELPSTIRAVTILADGDEAGEAAARAAADRWSRDGRRVRIARPPKGTDFNDLLNVDAEQGGESVS